MFRLPEVRTSPICHERCAEAEWRKQTPRSFLRYQGLLQRTSQSQTGTPVNGNVRFRSRYGRNPVNMTITSLCVLENLQAFIRQALVGCRFAPVVLYFHPFIRPFSSAFEL